MTNKITIGTDKITVKDSSSSSTAVTVLDKGVRGRTGLVWREDWSGSSDYYVGDAVHYQGSSYVCKKYVASNVAGFPPSLTDNWHILSSVGAVGDSRTNSFYTATSPTGVCSINTHAVEAGCLAAGGTWSPVVIGDIWVNSSTKDTYMLSSSSPINWEEISYKVISTNVTVSSHNSLPSGSLQNALEHLENKAFQQSVAPTGSAVGEGDLWYDTITDRMNVYRNNTWELLVTSSALSDSTGYDSISMNGGYF